MFNWLAECSFASTETVGLLGRGAQDVHFDFHTAPEFDHQQKKYVHLYTLKSKCPTIGKCVQLYNPNDPTKILAAG